MQTLTLNLKLTENRKAIPLSVLCDRVGVWLRRQAPDIMEKQNYFKGCNVNVVEKMGFVNLVRCEIRDTKLCLKYNYQKGVRRVI